MTFAFGDYSRTTENMSDNEVIDEIKKAIEGMLETIKEGATVFKRE